MRNRLKDALGSQDQPRITWKILCAVLLHIYIIGGFPNRASLNSVSYAAKEKVGNPRASDSQAFKEVDYYEVQKILEEIAFGRMTSPLGDKVLYHVIPKEADEGMLDIMVMNTDGSGLCNVTSTPRKREIGAWAEDGRIIYKEYEWKGMEGWNVIGWNAVKNFVIDCKGKNKQEISDDQFYELMKYAVEDN